MVNTYLNYNIALRNEDSYYRYIYEFSYLHKNSDYDYQKEDVDPSSTHESLLLPSLHHYLAATNASNK